ATWPDVSANGRSIVFVGYTADGFDLFDMPYPGSNDAKFRIFSNTLAPGTGEPGRDLVEARSAKTGTYNPLASLRPTSWSPILEGDRDQLRIGFATGGEIGRAHV